jgi:hypothetical protein
MDGWMDGWMDAWIDGCMDGYICHGRDGDPIESAILPVEIAIAIPASRIADSTSSCYSILAIAISTGRDHDRHY